MSSEMIGPNRKLKMQYARDDETPFPSGILALANMRPGESFVLAGVRYTVKSISDKSIIFTIGDGRRVMYRPFSDSGQPFLRRLNGLLYSHYIGVVRAVDHDAGDLARAWERDPAYTPWPERPRVLKEWPCPRD